MTSPSLTATLAPVAAAFEQLGTKYCLCGSMAAAAHGFASRLDHLEVMASLAAQHVAPLVETLQDRYHVRAEALIEAVARRSCASLVHLDTALRIEIAVVGPRPFDWTMLERAYRIAFHEADAAEGLFFASPEDVVLCGLERSRLGRAIRETPWGDVIGVLKVQQNHLDRPYLERWAAELGVADLLARAWKQAEGY